MNKPIKHPTKMTIQELLAIFTTPRHDHPGRKTGCDFRRGCFSGKVTRQKK